MAEKKEKQRDWHCLEKMFECPVTEKKHNKVRIIRIKPELLGRHEVISLREILKTVWRRRKVYKKELSLSDIYFQIAKG